MARRKEVANPNIADLSEGVSGNYYHGLLDGERICGQVYYVPGYSYHTMTELYLYNNQGIGERNEDCEYSDEYTYVVEMDVDRSSSFAQQVSEQGLTRLTLVKDQRLIKLIEATKLGSFDTWTVRAGENGAIQFGCGAVELNEEEMREFHRVETIKRSSNESDLYEHVVNEISGHIDPEEVDLDEVQKLLDKVSQHRKTGVVVPAALYQKTPIKVATKKIVKKGPPKKAVKKTAKKVARKKVK